MKDIKIDPFSKLKNLCDSDNDSSSENWFQEVEAFIKDKSLKDPEVLSLEELRVILVDYIQDELVKAKESEMA